MTQYYGLQRHYGPKAFLLGVEYSFDDVPDPFAVHEEREVPHDFLRHFRFKKKRSGELQDLLANDVGWFILSPRLVSVVSAARNASQVRLLPLPQAAVSVDGRLAGYCILGVKARVACLNLEKSDIRWGSLPDDGRHVMALYRGVLDTERIPEDCDIFYMKEDAGFPLMSSFFVEQIVRLQPTGVGLEKLYASAEERGSPNARS